MLLLEAFAEVSSTVALIALPRGETEPLGSGDFGLSDDESFGSKGSGALWVLSSS